MTSGAVTARERRGEFAKKETGADDERRGRQGRALQQKGARSLQASRPPEMCVVRGNSRIEHYNQSK